MNKDDLYYEAKTVAYELSHPMLCEMANVYVDRDDNMTFQVNCSEDHNVDYFKVYNHQSYKKASKVARISLFEAKYIYHKNDDGKEDWELNAKERKLLVKKLQMEVRGLTVWQRLIITYNLESGLNEEETLENLKDNLKYPYYLPIDMEMPYYTKLR